MKPGYDDLEKRIKELEWENLSLKDKYQFNEFFAESINTWEAFRSEKGKLIYLSKSFTALTGYDIDDYLKGRLHFLNWVHPDDLEGAKQNFQKQLDGQKLTNFTCRMYHKDKSMKYITISSKPVYNDKNEYLGFRTRCIDITEIKQKEIALKASEERFKLLNQLFTELLKLHDLESIYKNITKSLHNCYPNTFILYNSIDEATNQTCLESVEGLDNLLFNKLLKIIGFNPIGKKFELVPKHNDYIRSGKFVQFEGGMGAFSASAIPGFVASAIEKLLGLHKIYTIGILREEKLLASIHFFTFNKTEIKEFDFIETFVNQAGVIIQKKLAEFALKESEAQNKALLNALPDMMFIQDSDGVYIQYHAPHAENLLVSPDVFLGKKMKDVLPPEIAEEFKSVFKKAIESNALQRYEYALPISGGKEYFESRTIAYEENKILSIVRDITERKQAQDLIEQTRENYESFFNTINEFLFVLDEKANIIHTNNTVLERLGYSQKELYNQPVLIVHPPERREEAGRIVGEMLMGKTEFCPVPLITKQGEQIPVETIVKPGVWNNQKVIFGVSKDISKLELSEEKFSKAFHSNSILMAISNFATGKFIDVNKAFLETMGFTKEEVIGKTSIDLELFVNPEMRKFLFADIDSKTNKREVEVEVRTKKGDVRTGIFSIEKIHIANQLCLITAMLDITERKSMEKALKTSENRFRHISSTISDIAYSCIKDGKQDFGLEWIMGATISITGWTIEELIEMQCWGKIVIKEDYLIFKENVLDLIPGKSKYCELRIKHKNGEVNWIGSYAQCIESDNNGEILLLGGIIDINERKKAEKAIKESEIKFKTIADFTYDWEFWLAPDNTFIYISPSCKRITGYTPQDFKTDPELIDKIIYPDDSYSYHNHTTYVQESKMINEIDFRIYTKDDQIRWISHICQPVFDENRNYLGIRGNNRDITTRKEAENKIQELNEKLINLNADKDRFISILAHDLKSPYNTILGFLNLLNKNIRKYDLNKIENQIQIISRSAMQFYRLLEDLLSWAMAQSGKLPFEPAKEQLSLVIEDVAEELRLIANAKSIKINVIIEVGLIIYADVNMLKTILRNLISNAIKFTNTGGQIDISAAKNDKSIMISIFDTGVGIEPELIEKLFDISQIHSTPGTADEKGTGLGLLLCKELIEKHHGEIWAESTVNVGSVFHLSIPD